MRTNKITLKYCGDTASHSVTTNDVIKIWCKIIKSQHSHSSATKYFTDTSQLSQRQRSRITIDLFSHVEQLVLIICSNRRPWGPLDVQLKTSSVTISWRLRIDGFSRTSSEVIHHRHRQPLLNYSYNHQRVSESRISRNILSPGKWATNWRI